jgi:hypothetical protein
MPRSESRLTSEGVAKFVFQHGGSTTLQVSRDDELAMPDTPAATRWVALVLSALPATSDPKTRADWARLAHVSRGTLENRCRAAGLSAKASLALLRVLRAVIQAERAGCRPEDLLDADPRTLERIRTRAGLAHDGSPSSHRVGALEFLERQRFVVDRLALVVLRRALCGPRPSL